MEATDRELARDARIFETMVQMQIGKVEEAIATLEDALDPMHLANSSEGLLVSAYQMHGDLEKADSFAQLQLLFALQSLLGMSGALLRTSATSPERVRETVARVDAVARAYDLAQVMPNAVGQFNYQAAAMLCTLGDCEGALAQLEQFVQAMAALFGADDLATIYGGCLFRQAWQLAAKASGKQRHAARSCDGAPGAVGPFRRSVCGAGGGRRLPSHSDEAEGGDGMNIQDLLLVLIPLVIVELALLAYTLWHIFTHDSYKRGSRALWVVVAIVGMEFIGPLLYFLLGKEDA